MGLAIGAIVMAVTTAAAPHITPMVELTKQADVIRRTLDDADDFFVRTVEIGRDALTSIREEISFNLDDPEYNFYYGTDTGGRVVGVVLFPQANSQHGPVEVGLTLDQGGVVTSAIVTKATAETRPWVTRAVEAGLMEGFVGMRHGDDPERALDRLSSSELGSMPFFLAEVTAEAVKRGLVLHDALYASSD
jgi:hypothetical protein